MHESMNTKGNMPPRIDEQADYFTRLGVARGASRKEIETAFRNLSKEFHPDAGGDEEKMKLISEAWSGLKDDAKRAAYARELDGIEATARSSQESAYADVKGMREQFGSPREEATEAVNATDEQPDAAPEKLDEESMQDKLDEFARGRGYKDFESYIRSDEAPRETSSSRENMTTREHLDHEYEKVRDSMDRLGMQAKITCFAILYNTFILPFKPIEHGKGKEKKKVFDPATQVLAGAIDSTYAVGLLAMRVLMTAGRITLFGISRLKTQQ
ncbi:MAG: DnaJ domain-containing protein [Candidatus Pacebacteria bacterium]|nr:DnaJ domain-containing protein [Candidatus Paceibacterota bacterium]